MIIEEQEILEGGFMDQEWFRSTIQPIKPLPPRVRITIPGSVPLEPVLSEITRAGWQVVSVKQFVPEPEPETLLIIPSQDPTKEPRVKKMTERDMETLCDRLEEGWP